MSDKTIEFINKITLTSMYPTFAYVLEAMGKKLISDMKLTYLQRADRIKGYIIRNRQRKFRFIVRIFCSDTGFDMNIGDGSKEFRKKVMLTSKKYIKYLEETYQIKVSRHLYPWYKELSDTILSIPTYNDTSYILFYVNEEELYKIASYLKISGY